MPPKSTNSLSRSLKKITFSLATSCALIGASQQVQAQDCVDEVYYTEATTCTVPSGMNIVNLRVDGAGGGAGGSPYPPLRLGYGGARGAKGATVAGAVQVSPGATLHLRAGMAGQQGADAMGVPTVGGVGGTGDGHGGAGGGGRHGGGGGGGGGASSLNIAGTSMWVRAGGGGGGGGGGVLGFAEGVAQSAGVVQSDQCSSAASAAGDGDEVEPVSQGGASGGGGGNGGTYGDAPSTTHKAAAANWTPPAHGSQGGTTGDSCYSAPIEELSFVAEGNANGGINAEAAPNIPAAHGGLSLIFTFAADRTARISAISETGATVQAPQTMPPGYEVGSYRVACTGSAGDRASGVASGPAATAHVPMSLPAAQSWACEVSATLVDSLGGETIETLPTTMQSSRS